MPKNLNYRVLSTLEPRFFDNRFYGESGIYAVLPRLQFSNNLSSSVLRFMRLAWEVDPSLMGRNKHWVYVAKGGEYSKFWDDIHLVIDWMNNGAKVKEYSSSRLMSRFAH